MLRWKELRGELKRGREPVAVEECALPFFFNPFLYLEGEGRRYAVVPYRVSENVYLSCVEVYVFHVRPDGSWERLRPVKRHAALAEEESFEVGVEVYDITQFPVQNLAFVFLDCWYDTGVGKIVVVAPPWVEERAARRVAGRLAKKKEIEDVTIRVERSKEGTPPHFLSFVPGGSKLAVLPVYSRDESDEGEPTFNLALYGLLKNRQKGEVERRWGEELTIHTWETGDDYIQLVKVKEGEPVAVICGYKPPHDDVRFLVIPFMPKPLLEEVADRLIKTASLFFLIDPRYVEVLPPREEGLQPC